MSLQGAGGCRFWGFSPPTDLAAEAPPSASAAGDDEKPLRFFLCAVSDVRHMLHTLAAAARKAHESGAAARPMEFAVFEREPEVLARHLLLLAIALDFELPRRERAELLLEVWANAELREKTAMYVSVKAAALGRAIAHDEGPLAPLLDLSSMKSRDRDLLEQVLRSWDTSVEFDVVRLRDERLRQYFGTRYESRKNVLEWDLNMELNELASIVHKIHYRDWRMTGLYFEVRDSTYNHPNRTLASFATGRQHGLSVMKRGFWCDIANGPFVATGVTCDDERLTNKRSDMHHKSSADIAYYNTLGYLSSLETGVSFTLKQEDITDFEYGGSVASGGIISKGFLSGKKDEPALGALVEEEEEGEQDPEAVAKAAAAAAADAKKAAETRAKVVAAKMAKLPPFKLKLLGGDWLDVQKKPRHQKAFDVLVLGTQFAFVMGSERLNGLLRPNATVLLETAKWLTEVRKKARNEYVEKLTKVASNLGWTLTDDKHTPDGCADAFVRYTYEEDYAAGVVAETLARVKAAKEAGGKPAAAAEVPTLASEGAEGGEEGGEASDGAATKADPAASAMLKIADGADADVTDVTDAPADAKAAPTAEIKLTAGSAADLKAASNGKLCAITGKPARYKDPISGLPYADLAAFKELRLQYPDPKAAEKEAAAKAGAAAAAEAAAKKTAPAAKVQVVGDDGEEGGEGGEGEVIKPLAPIPSERPIQLGENFVRRVNKIC